MGRILGIDYGLKRVGLAITDDLRMFSSPLKVLPNNSELLESIHALCKEYGVDLLLVGLPVSETYHEAESMVTDFAKRIQEEIELPVVFQDESYSSVYAESFLKTSGKSRKKRKQEIDKFAAHKILSDYLNK